MFWINNGNICETSSKCVGWDLLFGTFSYKQVFLTPFLKAMTANFQKIGSVGSGHSFRILSGHYAENSK